MATVEVWTTKFAILCRLRCLFFVILLLLRLCLPLLLLRILLCLPLLLDRNVVEISRTDQMCVAAFKKHGFWEKDDIDHMSRTTISQLLEGVTGSCLGWLISPDAKDES